MADQSEKMPPQISGEWEALCGCTGNYNVCMYYGDDLETTGQIVECQFCKRRWVMTTPELVELAEFTTQEAATDE